MITLDVDQWCNNCPEFEAEVDKDTYLSNDFMVEEKPIYTTDTKITCKHRQRCRSMVKELENRF